MAILANICFLTYLASQEGLRELKKKIVEFLKKDSKVSGSFMVKHLMKFRGKILEKVLKKNLLWKSTQDIMENFLRQKERRKKDHNFFKFIGDLATFLQKLFLKVSTEACDRFFNVFPYIFQETSQPLFRSFFLIPVKVF